MIHHGVPEGHKDYDMVPNPDIYTLGPGAHQVPVVCHAIGSCGAEDGDVSLLKTAKGAVAALLINHLRPRPSVIRDQHSVISV